jgi:hypothetical protein
MHRRGRRAAAHFVAGCAVDMADKVNGKDVDEIVIERFL